MKKASVLLFILLSIFLFLSGCASLIIGGAAGALGGYAISKDTIQGETDKSFNALWNSALLVSRIRGSIKQEDAAKGYIELESDGSRVWIKLTRLTRSTTRIRVSARKFHLPKIDLAQEIYAKIIEQAA